LCSIKDKNTDFKCPLQHGEGCVFDDGNFGCPDYFNWFGANLAKDRQRYARIIYNKILAWKPEAQ